MPRLGRQARPWRRWAAGRALLTLLLLLLGRGSINAPVAGAGWIGVDGSGETDRHGLCRQLDKVSVIVIIINFLLDLLGNFEQI